MCQGRDGSSRTVYFTCLQFYYLVLDFSPLANKEMAIIGDYCAVCLGEFSFLSGLGTNLPAVFAEEIIL